jgi:hypothetical protein
MLFTALGTLLAVAVAVVLLLTLPGSSSTPKATSSAHASSAAYAPLLQPRHSSDYGTGERPPASAVNQTAPVGQSGPVLRGHVQGLAPVQWPVFLRHAQGLD